MHREPRLAQLTAEDMHLSFSVQKYLRAPTLVVAVPPSARPLAQDHYALEMTDVSSTTLSMFALRAVLARAWLARGYAQLLFEGATPSSLASRPPIHRTVLFKAMSLSAQRTVSVPRYAPVHYRAKGLPLDTLAFAATPEDAAALRRAVVEGAEDLGRTALVSARDQRGALRSVRVETRVRRQTPATLPETALSDTLSQNSTQPGQGLPGELIPRRCITDATAREVLGPGRCGGCGGRVPAHGLRLHALREVRAALRRLPRYRGLPPAPLARVPQR